MAVLITGGAGFVGLNLVEQCLQAQQQLVLFGPLPAAACEYLQHFPNASTHLYRVEADVREAEQLDRAIQTYGVRQIVHGAAITADLEREKTAARAIVDVNLGGTIEVLEAALRHNIERVIQLGTGSVFGPAGNVSEPLDELTSPALPVSLYGISKYAAERAAVRYRQARNLNVSVLRLGMVFGRWEYPSGLRDTLSLPWQLTEQARAGAHVVLHAQAGDDWVYADDVAAGIRAALSTPTLNEPVYHLSAGLAWSLPEWCALLKQTYPQFSYEFSHCLEDCTLGQNKAAKRAIFNIQRLMRDTAYTPQYLLPQAFRHYMSWSQQYVV